MTILRGEHQRARARPRLVLLGLEGLHIDLDGPLALQERHERPPVPILCRKHERGEAAHAYAVGVGAGVEEGLRRADVAVACGVHEGCRAVLIRKIERRVPHELADDVLVAI